MNAVEIEEAVSQLAERPFDAREFPFAFLEAFGNKATTIKRLRGGASNKSTSAASCKRTTSILPYRGSGDMLLISGSDAACEPCHGRPIGLPNGCELDNMSPDPVSKPRPAT